MRNIEIERSFWQACGADRRRYAPTSSKVGSLVRVGPTPLPGIETGVLAIELGPRNNLEHSRLWVCSEESWQIKGNSCLLARLCHQIPLHMQQPGELLYWIDPSDSFTQVSGIGAEWLLLTEESTAAGLVLARLNTLMLDLEAITALGLAVH